MINKKTFVIQSELTSPIDKLLAHFPKYNFQNKIDRYDIKSFQDFIGDADIIVESQLHYLRDFVNNPHLKVVGFIRQNYIAQTNNSADLSGLFTQSPSFLRTFAAFSSALKVPQSQENTAPFLTPILLHK